MEITICANQISVKNENLTVIIRSSCNLPIVMKNILPLCRKYENYDCETEIVEVLNENNTVTACYYLLSNKSSM